MTRRSPETGSGVPPIPPAPGDMSNQGRSLADAVQAGETANQRSSGEKKGFLRRTKERIKQIGRTAARAWRLGFEQGKAKAGRRRIRPIDAADEPENPERSLVRSDEPITNPGTTETTPTQAETPEPKRQDKSSAETVQKKEREDEDSIAAKRQEILKKLKKAAEDIDKYGIRSIDGRKAVAKTIKYGEQLDRLRERTKKEKTPAGDEEGSEIERSESLPARDELIDGMQRRRQDLNKKLSTPGFRFPGGEIGKRRDRKAIQEELDAVNEEWDRFGGKAIEEAQDKGSETEQKLQKEIEELEAKAGLKFPGGEFEKKRKIEILKDKLEKAKNAAKADIEAARDAFYARFVADQVKEEIPPAPIPTGDDARRARIDDLEKILNDPETTDSEKDLADLERKILLDELNADEDTEDDEDSPDTEITPEDKELMDNKAEKALDEARSQYAELRAEYEQMGFARKLFGGKALKEELENAREKLQTILSYVMYHQILGWEKENAESSGENKQNVEQGKVGKETIQAIAFATIGQYEIIEKETQGWYDRKLDERSWFKKVAAKIGQWFVGKENKDGGKLGLGGWLRSGGTGLAAGVATGLFGVSFPITSALGVAGGAGVKFAAHQRALENGREEDRSLGQGYVNGVVKKMLDTDWTVEYQDQSGNMAHRSASKKEIVKSVVGGMLENTQRDTERRQRNMVAIGRKAAMGWGLGFAAGKFAGDAIKDYITPDQKPANAADPSKSPDKPDPSKTPDKPDPSNPGTGEGGGQGGAPDGEITPPSETVSLGSDGWVWDRVADVLGAEKAMPFLEQLAQTNPDFQLIDLPNGLTGIAYQGNTDPQVVADAIGRVAPDLLRQWILAA